MCGIAGVLEPSGLGGGESLRSLAERMAGALSHRGPDDGGVWLDPEAGLALGHRRLKVVDLSPEGAQPMLSAGGRYAVSFNGELYNFRELRRELEESGCPPFRGSSDTEVLLAAFERWGVPGAVCRFNGMFAFALWDRGERRLHLGRDRIGEKPLYYAWTASGLAFGSELKALRVHPGLRFEVDLDSLGQFLRYYCIPSPRSIYRGVFKLPPGTVLSVGRADLGRRETFSPDPGGGALSPAPYWSALRAAEEGLRRPFQGSEEEAVDELEALLRDSVKLRMAADVPLGASLSGGIDSSTVVALMQAQSAAKVRTFSIGSEEAGYDEARQAKEVARHLGTDHTELTLTPREAMAVIPRLPAIYDEPFADPSQIPTFLVSELARRHVTVSLSGDGGDELFGGYTRYTLGGSILRGVGWLPRPAGRALAGLLRLPGPRQWDLLAPALKPFLRSYGTQGTFADKFRKAADVLEMEDPDGLYYRLVSAWDRPGAVLAGRAPDWRPGWHGGRSPEIADPVQRMMYLDLAGYLPDDILVKVDRASMAVSLEARAPMLDHRVVEFSWRLPQSMKIRGAMGKWALRQVLYRHVPRRLVERPKMGFGVPIGSWLRGPLREWAESLLFSKALSEQGFFEPAAIREAWDEHLSGRRDRQCPLWCVLMFQAWLEAQGARP